MLQLPKGAEAKVDDESFPFSNPVASSFVFQEGEKAQSSPEAASSRGGMVDRSNGTLHKPTVSVTDSEDFRLSDAFHDPEDGSITDSDASHSLSMDREGRDGALNQGPQWDSTRSFDYGGVVGLSSRAMSSRAVSGFLEMSMSGRFSVDLNRGQKLDKAQHRPSPDVRLRMFASEKSSKRSILSPCLVRTSSHTLQALLNLLSCPAFSFPHRTSTGDDEMRRCMCSSLSCRNPRIRMCLEFNNHRPWRRVEKYKL